jgi:hypothetical protein
MTVPVLWLGFVLAISFMEAPLRFKAPHASHLAALSIGQLVFRTLARVESVLLLTLIVALWRAAWPDDAQPWAWVLGGVTTAQQLWLLPQLDRRANAVLGGQKIAAGRRIHRLYVAGECLKVVFLSGLAWSLGRHIA